MMTSGLVIKPHDVPTVVVLDNFGPKVDALVVLRAVVWNVIRQSQSPIHDICTSVHHKIVVLSSTITDSGRVVGQPLTF